MAEHDVAELEGDLPSAAAGTALPDRKELASVAFERTRTPMVITDARQPDYPIVLANKAFLELTGYSADEVLGRNCRFLQGEGSSPAAVAEIRSALRAGREVDVEILNYRKDGSSFWNQLNLSPVYDEAGQLLYHFGSQIDQTKYRQVQALEASEHRLLMEVDHRAKNVLALVDSIVRLSRCDDAVRYSAAIQQRVQSLSRTHALLAEHNWRAMRLGEVIKRQLQTLAERQVSLEGPELEIDPLTVQPLGLVVHELAMNAAQHGSLTNPKGHVSVHWKHMPNEHGFSIQWAESGGPPVHEPAGSGFGLVIADGIVRRQLLGKIRRSWKPAGLVATIQVPELQSTCNRR
ncbi:PAS domain-containing protein [Devosia sp. 1566]|uniref:blue-light-activated histidine kinase n=1 Tax=Devosia sp. 1566 TaxID=2499144 RepID=UPI000FDB02C6|nr:PAS domain-containing protein [Devosia sp. 1566]